MVMLHMAQNSYKHTKDELIVAHFDHGIRENSAEDAEFVRRKAEEYGLECRIGRGNLGAGASEAEARKARYGFLYDVLNDVYDKGGGWGEIWTAHHLDDLVESVAINFIRGTGWRGLAVLDSKDIRRPFLDLNTVYLPMDKEDIFTYAAKHELQYREDPSNSWDEYLRNRIRHQMNNSKLSHEKKLELYWLWQRQRLVKAEIERLDDMIAPTEAEAWERKWFTKLSREVALELLRYGTERMGVEATRPQLEDFRQSILNYAPGKYFNLPGDRLVKLGKDRFEI